MSLNRVFDMHSDTTCNSDIAVTQSDVHQCSINIRYCLSRYGDK